jgi:hypothetical protein
MALTVQRIPCGAQNLGGGYSEPNHNDWNYGGVVAGRSYEVTLHSYGGGGSSNFGATYGSSCSIGCDAWHTGPTHTFVAITNGVSILPIGRNNGGGNLQFTDYSIQDLGSDDSIPTVQVATGLCAAGAVSIASPTAGNLLVATEFLRENGGAFAASGVPSGWTAASVQYENFGAADVGAATRTLYKAATGSETNYTPAGTGYANPDYVVVREYGGGLAGANLLGFDNDSGTGNGAIDYTFPSGTVLSLLHIGWGTAKPALSAADPEPWTFDYYHPLGVTGLGICGRDVSPTPGADAQDINVGSSGPWVAQAIHFGAPVPSGPGPRSHSVMVG